jgi:cysteine desulfurase
LLYFDHAASAPPYPEVITSMASTMERYYANPSSLHRMGQAAEQLIGKARRVIANALNVNEQEIIFTSGGTESNNLAIKGAAWRYRQRGKHIITSMLEHASVYEACRQLEREGFEITYLEADEEGRVSAEQVKQAIRKDTFLVSLMHVNNETGAIQPIGDIGKLLSAYPRILFHVDAVQSTGKISFDPGVCHIDLFSVSAHKLHGPRGIGLLYCRKDIQLEPLISGGGQEHGLRSGTEPVPLITGMAKAIRLTSERREEAYSHVRRLRKYLLDRLRTIDGVIITGSSAEEHMSPFIVHICVPNLRSEVLLHTLEESNIFVSTKSACSSGENKPSRVLLAMGMTDAMARSGLRISLSSEHKLEDMDTLADAILHGVEQLREVT